MKEIMRTGIILFLICAVSAGLCGIVNSVTAPVIAENLLREREAALAVAAGEYTVGEEVAIDTADANVAYTIMDGDEAVGYVFELNASGYGGAMNIIASYYFDGELINAELTTNSETPGLGKRAEEPSYMDMFRGHGASSPLPASSADLSSDDAAAVSGATVTFTGVSTALRNGSELAKSLGGAK